MNWSRVWIYTNARSRFVKSGDGHRPQTGAVEIKCYDAAWNLNYRTNNGLLQSFGVDSGSLSGSETGARTEKGTRELGSRL